jgi:prepilin-type N-terminal cleavage/methylation domain-containing protein
MMKTAPTRKRGGFTFVELLVAMTIMGILAGLAIPNITTIILRARAVDVSADLEVVAIAARSYNADLHSWPSEAAAGTIPGELVPFLPAGFSFDQDGYQLDFENWNLPGGLPGDPSTRTLIGVSVVAADAALGNAVLEHLGANVIMSVGNTHTVIIDRN